MAEPAGSLHRAVPGRGLDRRGRAPRRRVFVAQPASANRRREQVRANGNIGMESAAKSAADGYTVLVTTDALSSNPHAYKMNIDPLKELTPVVQLSRQPIVLAAHPSLGVASLAELIALAKQQPGLRYATGSGLGAQHMVVQ